MERLPAGTYRIKVQSTNANNWSYANSAYQTFTVKENHLTITYNANGGSVSPGAELVSKNSTYDLPTPTRKNAAFLGWYTAVGKELVTNGTKLKSTYGQTLVAKWDTSGHSFVKSKTYQNNFKDVSSRAWYYPYVTAAYSYGLMDGIETNKFKPDKQISAAQTITLAARLRKLYLTGNGTFANSSPWYKAYSDYAISQGIISSLPSDMNAPLTRQEFASILAKALPSSALPRSTTYPTAPFPTCTSPTKGSINSTGQGFSRAMTTPAPSGPMPPSPGRRSLPCWSVWPTPTPESSSLWTKFSFVPSKAGRSYGSSSFFRVTSFRRLTGPNP